MSDPEALSKTGGPEEYVREFVVTRPAKDPALEEHSFKIPSLIYPAWLNIFLKLQYVLVEVARSR